MHNFLKPTTIHVDMGTFRAREPLPICPHCGALARPNVLMFGDLDWVSDRSDTQEYRLLKWLKDLQRNGAKLAVVEIGAGKAVPTVRYQSERVAGSNNGTLIRINPRDYEVPAGQIAIPLGGFEGIKRVLAS